MNWTEVPLVRPVLVFITGMLAASHCHLHVSACIYTASIFLFFYVFLTYPGKPLQRIKHKMGGLFLMVIFFATGGGMYSWKCLEVASLDTLKQKETEKTFIVTLLENKSSENTVSFHARMDAIEGFNDKSSPFWPGIVVRFSREDSAAWDYDVFDQLIITGVLGENRPNTNPEAFDYAGYLQKMGIAGQINVGKYCHLLRSKENTSKLQLTASNINKWIKEKLILGIPDKQEQAVSLALLCGDDSLIDDQLYKVYSATGAVHVLSVSGLHVAIFIGAFVWLFSLWPSNSPYATMSKLIILLFLIGFYTFITGLSASVVRSGLMIAMVLVAKAWRKNVHAIHVLTLTAFAMLFYNPYYLDQISFQFSYLSLVSILYFEPFITPLIKPQSWLGRQIWQLTSVSVAAQMLMIPWSIWYFHQLSLTFVISGVIAVPLVTIIMYFGAFLLVSESIFSPISIQVYSFFSSLVGLLNDFILWLGSLPFAALNDAWATLPALICILLVQVFWMMWLANRKIANWYAMGFCITAALFWIQYHDLGRSKKQGLVVYDIYGKTLIDLFAGSSRLTWSTLEEKSKAVQFAAKSLRIKWGINHPCVKTLNSGLYCIANRQVYIAGKNTIPVSENAFLHADIIIDTGWPDMPPADIVGSGIPHDVVLAGGVGWKRRKQWLELARTNSFSIHIVNSEGAFVLENR